MTNGSVSLTRWPTVVASILDADGTPRTIEARIDTGFSDDLTLPGAVISRLGLQRLDRANYRIGDDRTVTFDTYVARIVWHDLIRRIIVLESEVSPVVGVGLLWGSNLSVDFRHGGDVTIRELEDG